VGPAGSHVEMNTEGVRQRVCDNYCDNYARFAVVIPGRRTSAIILHLEEHAEREAEVDEYCKNSGRGKRGSSLISVFPFGSPSGPRSSSTVVAKHDIAGMPPLNVATWRRMNTDERTLGCQERCKQSHWAI
jgi:hypothetical protein